MPSSRVHVEVRGTVCIPLDLSTEFYEILDDPAMRAEVSAEALRIGLEERLGGYRLMSCAMVDDGHHALATFDIEDYASKVRHMQRTYDLLLSRVREALDAVPPESPAGSLLQAILDEECSLNPEGPAPPQDECEGNGGAIPLGYVPLGGGGEGEAMDEGHPHEDLLLDGEKEVPVMNGHSHHEAPESAEDGP